MKKVDPSRGRNIKKILNYMFGGFFIKSQLTGIVAAVVLLGFVELFVYFNSPSTFMTLNLYVAVLFLSIIAIRLVVALRVERIMYTNLEALEEQKGDEKLAVAKPVEKRASAMPVVNVDQYADLANDKRVVDLREASVKRARSVYLLAMGRDIAAGVGYIVLSIVASQISPSLEMLAGFGISVGFIGLLLVFLRFLFHFRNFRPKDAGTEKMRHPVFELIRAISQPKNQTIFFYYVILQTVVFFVISLTEKSVGSALGLLLFVGLHYALVMFMKPKEDRNIKLLVLRTF